MICLTSRWVSLQEWVLTRLLPLFAGIHPYLLVSEGEGEEASAEATLKSSDLLAPALVLTGVQAVIAALSQAQSLIGAPDGEITFLFLLLLRSSSPLLPPVFPDYTFSLLDSLPPPMSLRAFEVVIAGLRGEGEGGAATSSSAVERLALRSSLLDWQAGGLEVDALADLCSHASFANDRASSLPSFPRWLQCLRFLSAARASVSYSALRLASDSAQSVSKAPPSLAAMR